MRKSTLCTALGVVTLLLVVMSGCGGGGGGVPPPADTGSVSGQVLYYNDQPLGGVTVSVVYVMNVDGQEVTVEKVAVSDDNGNFRITGIDPGRNRLLRIVPPDWLAVPSQTAVYVDVVADQNTVLPAPVMLIPVGEGPPDVPTL